MSGLRIHLLPENVANLIAAGEVVERPASVVKELIENALDAGATQIEIAAENAGFSYIRVTDDGHGMLPEDARLAFSRHATSKISGAEDLERIKTLGFRGEALPSIASVSRLELTTRPDGKSAGFRLRIEGGTSKFQGEIGCSIGTSLIIKDLFFNTPARRKFMKSRSTEQSHLTQIVELAAAANCPVRFRLILDKREILNCPKTQDLEERLVALYGKSLPQQLYSVEREAGNIWIRGLIGGLHRTRPNRQGMRFFINHRPVEHRGVAHAVLQAYRTLIPEGRFPFCFLFLSVPEDKVDVNVHPAKREVRFQDEHAIHNLVQTAVKHTLRESGLSSGSVLEQPGSGFDPVFRPVPEARYTQPLSLNWSGERVKETCHTYLENNNPVSGIPDEGEEITEVRVVGQVGKTYIAAQDAEGFFLIDQHAAHERILYDLLCQWPERLPRQMLLLPMTFEVAPSRSSLLDQLLDFFNKLGLEISPLGGNTYIIQTQPELFEKGNLAAMIIEVLEQVAENGCLPEPAELHDLTLKTMACHAAVKSGERLQPEAMLGLINRLKKHNCMPTCPHGRPYIFRLTWKELDKIFKRT
ncbi:DNA mismatch repair endonuclease MutL [bacterium]|nr:DNA mismatch repair endonuclease MutL [bacterium]